MAGMTTPPPAPRPEAVPVPARSVARQAARPRRLRGVDVLRGLAVVGMLFVDNRGNAAIADQLQHQAWDGLRIADVVFPVFLLVVGVSIPFSRRAAGPRAVLTRVAKLAVLGWLIVTAKYGWGTPGAGVLGHIAGAFLLCWLLLRLPRPAQLPTAAGVLAALSVLTVVGGADPDRSWAHEVDAALGLPFSAEAPHSYLASAVTVFLGVLAGRALQDGAGRALQDGAGRALQDGAGRALQDGAGRALQDGAGRALLARLVAGGTALLVTGAALSALVPVNKRLWSPSFVLVTAGIGVLLLALLHWLVDQRGRLGPLRVFEVLGLNAIVAFVVSELLFRAVLSHTVQPAVDAAVSSVVGGTASAWLYPVLSVTVIWAVCATLLRRGVVVRI